MPAPDDGLGGVTVTQEQKDAQYLRSVHAFWCPICLGGFQRPAVITMTRDHDAWEYECDHCGMTGTRKEIKHAAPEPVEEAWLILLPIDAELDSQIMPDFEARPAW